jgi:Ca2+-binding RTX toxin-like protein
MPTFTGTDGANTLAGGVDADTLIGLGGDDLYLVNSMSDEVVEETGGGFDMIETSVLDGLGRYDLSLLPQVEGLRYSGTLSALLTGQVRSKRWSIPARQRRFCGAMTWATF